MEVKMSEQVRWDLVLKERFDQLLSGGQYDEIRTLLQTDKQIIDEINDLAIARVMLSVCDQEKEAGQQTVYDKVNSLEELVRRYTILMFYLRRFEFDIMDDNMAAFRQFLSMNHVSLQELFAVMYCGNIDKEKVLRIIKDKMLSGEIVI